MEESITIQEKNWAGRREAEIWEKGSEEGGGIRNEYERKRGEIKRKDK
jgi:hypothetical protein